MTLRPFKELIGLSKEKLDEAMAPIRARTVQAKAQLEQAKLDGEILAKESAIQELCIRKDIDFPALLDALDALALLERRRAQYVNVLAQLFPPDAR